MSQELILNLRLYQVSNFRFNLPSKNLIQKKIIL